MRNIFYTSMLLSILILFFAETGMGDDTNFRQTKWGMTKEQVKSSEPLKVSEERNDILGYKSSVINKDVFIIYFFAGNQLTRARYFLAESHTNKNDFIRDYKDFKKILTKKYGPSETEDKIWKNDLYKDDYSNWGMAISLGHLVYMSTWETEDTEIAAMLLGENYDVSCVVEYTSKNLKELEDKAKEQKAMDNF